MAHEIETDANGEGSAFYVGEPAWHGLGKVLPRDQDLTIPDAIVAAGLDWEVTTAPLVLKDDHEVGVPAFATRRTTDGSILGVVGPGYVPLQNIEAFKWFSPFLDSGLVKLEAAGSLRGGKRIWVLGKIQGQDAEVVAGDPIGGYVLLSNSHDGTMAIRSGFTRVRVVCQNTLSAAHREGTLLRIRHTSGATLDLEKVREIMDVAAHKFNLDIEVYQSLARRNITADDLDEYVRAVFDLPSAEDQKQKVNRTLDNVVNLFEQGRGAQLKGVRGTVWGAYNAVSEYVTHERGRDQNVRVDSTWFGDGQRTIEKALDIGLKLAA